MTVNPGTRGPFDRPPAPELRRSCPEPGDVPAGDLAAERSALTSVTWTAPETMGFEQWVASGRKLGAIGRGVGWWIGDWLRFGNARYGERYSRASKITGYDKQTLMNMAYVASNIDPTRRRETLSWSHHAEVASLAPDEQDRWLQEAEESRLSVQDLRILLREARRREQAVAIAVTPAPDAPPIEHATVCPECGHAFEARRRRDEAKRAAAAHPAAA